MIGVVVTVEIVTTVEIIIEIVGKAITTGAIRIEIRTGRILLVVVRRAMIITKIATETEVVIGMMVDREIDWTTRITGGEKVDKEIGKMIDGEARTDRVMYDYRMFDSQKRWRR